MTRARDLASMLHSDGSLNITTSVNLGDNEKAYFGDANDLVIFHNASKSIIEDVGTGNLEVRGTNIEFLDGTGSEYYLTMANNGSVGLYWDGNLKLSTTSTGVDVSGTVTADGLTVEVDGTHIYLKQTNGDFGHQFRQANDGGALQIGRNVNGTFTERMRIDGSGNVGIGTASPQKPLDVVSSAYDFVTVGARGLGVGEWTGIHFGYRENNTSYRKSAIVFQRTDLSASDGQGKIHILNGPQGSGGSATLSDAKITIAENGNVGIDTTSPGYKLDVSGSLKAQVGSSSMLFQDYNNGAVLWLDGADGDFAGGDYYGIYANNNGGFGIGYAGASDFNINSSGNVGIGTASPLAKLHTYGADALMRLDDTNGGISFIGHDATGAYWRTFTSDTHRFLRASGVESMRINSSGNVGIGTSNPTVPLHVKSAGGADFVAIFQNDSIATSYGVSISEPSGATAGYPLLRVGQGFSPYSDFLRVDTNGNTAFGTTPSAGARVHIETTSQDKAGLRIKRTFYNWFEWGGNPSGVYLHIKTGLYAGGGALGNIAYTMSLFEIKGYTYNAETIDTMIGFHNWSGGYSQLIIQNKGTRAAGSNPYTSSDGYVVLVVNTGTNYPGITINWHQAFPYTFRNVGVTSYASSSSSGGVY